MLSAASQGTRRASIVRFLCLGTGASALAQSPGGRAGGNATIRFAVCIFNALSHAPAMLRRTIGVPPHSTNQDMSARWSRRCIPPQVDVKGMFINQHNMGPVARAHAKSYRSPQESALRKTAVMPLGKPSALRGITLGNRVQTFSKTDFFTMRRLGWAAAGLGLPGLGLFASIANADANGRSPTASALRATSVSKPASVGPSTPSAASGTSAHQGAEQHVYHVLDEQKAVLRQVQVVFR